MQNPTLQALQHLINGDAYQAEIVLNGLVQTELEDAENVTEDLLRMIQERLDDLS